MNRKKFFLFASSTYNNDLCSHRSWKGGKNKDFSPALPSFAYTDTHRQHWTQSGKLICLTVPVLVNSDKCAFEDHEWIYYLTGMFSFTY
jgi:hypothetical protein